MPESLIFGGTGRLGRELRRVLPNAAAPTHAECDLTNPKSVEAVVAHTKPTLVISASGWTDVRGCESDRQRAWSSHVDATQNLVRALRVHSPGARLVYVSTACVFKGDRGDYTEDDVPYPANFYGVVKLAAEQVALAHGHTLLLRTDFISRAPWPHPGAFVDRWSTSVFADEAARAIAELATRSDREGLLHLCGSEKISHYDLARITTPDVKPIRLADMKDLSVPRDQSLRSVRGGDILALRP